MNDLPQPSHFFFCEDYFLVFLFLNHPILYIDIFYYNKLGLISQVQRIFHSIYIFSLLAKGQTHKDCVYCNKRFKLKSVAQRYCSEKCKRDAGVVVGIGFIENIKENKNNIMKNHFNWFEEYL